MLTPVKNDFRPAFFINIKTLQARALTGRKKYKYFK
jgi:hypothetical protein